MAHPTLNDQKISWSRRCHGEGPPRRFAESMNTHLAVPPKIIVVTPWYGGNEGGVAVVTESLVQSLMQEGVHCAAIIMAADGWRPKHSVGQSGERIVELCIRDRGAPASLVSRIGALIRDRVAARAFRALVPAKGRHCVVHLHYSMPEYSFFSTWCRRWGIPMVTTFHGSDLTVNLEDPRTLQVTRTVVHECRVVTAVSEALRRAAVEHFPEIEERSVAVHNAVPPDFATAAHRQTESTPRDIDVLYVGNLIQRKGVDVLLTAWQQVLKTLESARLTVAGAGEDAAALQALARELGIDHTVRFLGRQARRDLPALYRRAKVLAVSSRAEPLGVVVLEGLLCGTAVVASAVGGIPEIITHDVHGLLVPAENAPMLARGILQLLSDETLRTTLAAAGRERVEQYFSSQGVARQYRAIYDRALRTSGQRH